MNARDSAVPTADLAEQAIEKELLIKGLTAPRITPARIDAVIANTAFHVFPGTTVTVCCLTLNNGFNVVGESACASPENFDEEIGRKIAFGNARAKIGALEGYQLRTRLQGVEQMCAIDPEAGAEMAQSLVMAYLTPEQQLDMFEPEGRAQ